MQDESRRPEVRYRYALLIASLYCPQDKLDPANWDGRIPIDYSQIPRREVLQFGPPSCVGDFDPQHAT
jgi:hypothetical protein